MRSVGEFLEATKPSLILKQFADEPLRRKYQVKRYKTILSETNPIKTAYIEARYTGPYDDIDALYEWLQQRKKEAEVMGADMQFGALDYDGAWGVEWTVNRPYTPEELTEMQFIVDTYGLEYDNEPAAIKWKDWNPLDDSEAV